MRTRILLVFLSGILNCPLLAGTGAVFPDGESLVRTGENSLKVYSIDGNSEAEVVWPADCNFEYPVLSATKTVLLVGGEDVVVSYDPKEGKWSPFWNAPDGQNVENIAYDGKNERTVLVTSTEDGGVTWWIFQGAGKVPGKLFNRRAPGAGNPVFDGEGNLYFTVSGDLWKGFIDTGDDESVPFVLNGSRIWPLATLETDDGNSSGSSAKQIVPIGKWLVLELSRTGGSGWGSIIRVPNQDAFENHLPLKWDELHDCGTGSDAAVSADGKRGFTFIHGAGKWFEINGVTGEMDPLSTAE